MNKFTLNINNSYKYLIFIIIIFIYSYNIFIIYFCNNYYSYKQLKKIFFTYKTEVLSTESNIFNTQGQELHQFIVQ